MTTCLGNRTLSISHPRVFHSVELPFHSLKARRAELALSIEESNQAVAGPAESRLLSRSFAVMRALSGNPGGLSYGQLSLATGLPRATVHRIVAALEAEGAVSTMGGAGNIRLGAALAQLGAAVQCNLRAVIRPYLEQLQAQTGETVDLTMLVRGRPVVIEQFVAGHGLHVGSAPGNEFPLHTTASGLAHLSVLPRQEADRLLVATACFEGRSGPADRAGLLDRIGDIGAQGVHRDPGLWLDGVCAVAMPLVGPWTDNLAIAVTMPAHRHHRKADEVDEALKLCINTITSRTV